MATLHLFESTVIAVDVVEEVKDMGGREGGGFEMMWGYKTLRNNTLRGCCGR